MQPSALSTTRITARDDPARPGTGITTPLEHLMVLTKAELIGALQHETHVLLHLASKIDRTQLDYRPTARQRSTMELLRYLSLMGPLLTSACVTGTFDMAAWGAADESAKARDLDGTMAEIATHSASYAALLADVSDDDLRATISLFGNSGTRGAKLVSMVLSGCAAYRTQLFCYLKSCGREDLGSSNLWSGMDAPTPA
ncbi:hypothetical protein [Gemmatimonas sp.]|uniref:hypothetical protein n=1 Tax=Gemmatimonas sp. TaxID=1962908 RepID=UPI0037BF40B5